MAEILVIGVGNEFRGDDAVGIWVARQLAQSAPPRVAVIEQRGEGADLMDAWQGAEMVLLIDAASSGAKPGTIHRFTAHQAPLPAELFSFSSHAMPSKDLRTWWSMMHVSTFPVNKSALAQALY